MAYIVQSLIGNQGVQLGSEEFLRPMSFGSNWRRIRILCRAQVNTANVMAHDTGLRLGICQGVAGGVYTNTSNYIGGEINAEAGSYPWAMHASNNYQSEGGGGYCSGYTVQKLNGVLNRLPDGSGTGAMYVALASALNPLTHGVNITKNYYGSYTISTLGTASTQITSAYGNPYCFYRSLEDEQAYGFVTRVGTSDTYTSMSDFMDTVSVSWNHSCPTVEVTQLSVIRYA